MLEMILGILEVLYGVSELSRLPRSGWAIRRGTSRENRLGGALVALMGIAVAAGGARETWACGFHVAALVEGVTGVLLTLAGVVLICLPGRMGRM